MTGAEPPSGGPKPSGRWLRFSLRALLVLLVLLGIGVVRIPVKMRQAREQQQVVKAISRSGGVHYSYEQVNLDVPALALGATGLVKLFGQDFWFNVVFANVTDAAAMKHLEGLPQLRRLTCGERITDTGLQYVEGCTHLQELLLSRTKVSDAGVRHLRGLSELQYLVIEDTKVTDAALEQVRGLKRLEELDLAGTAVTDVGLGRLKEMPKLRFLELRNTKVSQRAVNAFRQARPDCKIDLPL